MSNFVGVLEGYEIWSYEKHYKTSMEEIYGGAIGGEGVGLKETMGKKLLVMQGPGYELAMNIIGIFNVCTLVFRTVSQDSGIKEFRYWMYL